MKAKIEYKGMKISIKGSKEDILSFIDELIEDEQPKVEVAPFKLDPITPNTPFTPETWYTVGPIPNFDPFTITCEQPNLRDEFKKFLHGKTEDDCLWVDRIAQNNVSLVDVHTNRIN